MDNKKSKQKNGILYLIPTPIGNLGDMTLRAIEAMKSVDLLLAEDTRVTRKLLTHFDIKVPIRSYHGFNERKKLNSIIELLHDGKSIALVSDAGMPGISDPGSIMVAACRDEGIDVFVLPGASAGITALVSSGFEIRGHLFEGFLPKKNKELEQKLQMLNVFPGAVVIYEAPNRIQKLIEKIALLMPNRLIHIAREMTKIHEEHLQDTASEISKRINETKPRGEYVIILAPLPPSTGERFVLDEAGILDFLAQCVESGLSVKDAAGLYCAVSGENRSEVYRVMNRSLKHNRE